MYSTRGRKTATLRSIESHNRYQRAADDMRRADREAEKKARKESPFRRTSNEIQQRKCR
jgi:hypothetical protein